MKSRERDSLGNGFFWIKVQGRTVPDGQRAPWSAKVFVSELEFLAGTEIKCPISAPKLSDKINRDNFTGLIFIILT